MKTHYFIPGCLALAMLTTASFAAASDIKSNHQSDFFAAGRHEFYLWCANGQDRVIWQDGGSASDARTKLSRKIAPAGCEAVWQGRIDL